MRIKLVILALTLLGRFGAAAQDLKEYMRYFRREERWEAVLCGAVQKWVYQTRN